MPAYRYRSTPFLEVLGGVLKLAGLSTAAQADTEARAQALEFINERTREAWEQEFWAELCPAEERWYREAWSGGADYAVGAEVWFPGYSSLVVSGAGRAAINGVYRYGALGTDDDPIYYLNGDSSGPRIELIFGGWLLFDGTEECYSTPGNTAPWLQEWEAVDADEPAPTVTQAAESVGAGYYRAVAVSAGFSPLNPARWAPLTTFRRAVALEQAGCTAMGEVFACYDRDPLTYPDTARRIQYQMTREGVLPRFYEGNSIWVRYRLRPPTYALTTYSAGTAYAPGDVVLVSGECHRCILASTGNAVTNATYWEPLPFPYVLAAFVKRAAYADMLPADGEGAAAGRELGKAYKTLSDASDTAILSQGQAERAQVRTY